MKLFDNKKKISFKIDGAKIQEKMQDYLLNVFSRKNISISQKEKINLFDSLYNLVSSGIPIPQAIGILYYQTKNKNTKNILDTFKKDISKGIKLEACMEKFPKIFSPFDVYIIKMGETTGKIGNSFEIIKNKEEKNAEIKGKIIGALIYPAIIITLSISMIIGFMVFVIPRVQKMYTDARVNLPDLTQNVINFSVFIQENAIILTIGLIAIIGGIISFKKGNKTKYYADKYSLYFPLFGPLIKKKILAIFSSTLGTLLQNGISIQESLEITKKSIENKYFEKRVDEIMIQINEGIPLSELMGIKKLQQGKEDSYFPIEFAAAVKIGEQTGKLASLLIKISHKYQREIDGVVKNLSTMIEPIVIVVVGTIVGTLVMAILLPFFNMVNVL